MNKSRIIKDKCKIDAPNILIKIFIFSIFILGCSQLDERQILGAYKIDKFDLKKSHNNVVRHDILVLKEDNIFELKGDNKSIIRGKWKIIKSNRNGIIFSLEFSERQQKGLLKGNIIRFEKPNHSYFKNYNIITYVKLINEIQH